MKLSHDVERSGKLTARIVVNTGLGKHSVVLQLGLSERRAVAGDDDQLGCERNEKSKVRRSGAQFRSPPPTLEAAAARQRQSREGIAGRRNRLRHQRTADNPEPSSGPTPHSKTMVGIVCGEDVRVAGLQGDRPSLLDGHYIRHRETHPFPGECSSTSTCSRACTCRSS